MSADSGVHSDHAEVGYGADLPEPWRVCLEEAWAAYQAGSLPIGAVVTDDAGQIVARGRNRIFEADAGPGR